MMNRRDGGTVAFSPTLKRLLSKGLVIGVLFVVFVFITGISADQDSKLGPLLNQLVTLNKQALHQTGHPLDLTQFSSTIGVYRDNVMVKPTSEASDTGSDSTSSSRTATELGALILTRGQAAFFTHPGVEIRSTFGSVATVRVSLREVQELVKSDEVSYIAVSRKVEPTLNQSVPAVGAEQLHTSRPIDKGSGVMIGIIDTGIDYDHPDFRINREPGPVGEESSRILYIWDQTSGADAPPRRYGYGSQYNRAEIEEDIANDYGPGEGLVRVADARGHGTHVAGIAAGDGTASPEGKYIGMAPKASLAVVKTSFTTASVLDAIEYIQYKAEKHGLPSVINLSLGTQFGSHDGTSLFERAVNNLSRPDSLIVVAAGNEGNHQIHLGDAVKDTERYPFVIPSYTLVGSVKDYVVLNGYYDGSSRLEAKIIGPNGNSTGWVGWDEMELFSLSSGSVCIANGPVNINHDNRLYVSIGEINGNTEPHSGRWRLVLRSEKGNPRLDYWVADHSLGTGANVVEFVNGNNRMTIAEPGNAKKVITVGSFNTKNQWGSSSVTGYPIGEPSSFSSRGPTRDGRVKPDLVAPGAWVASALAGSSNPPAFQQVGTGNYRVWAGTSMAAPHVSGAAALLWHAAPELTRQEIISCLLESTESFEQSYDKNYVGTGKLNIKRAVYSTGVPKVKVQNELWVKATPNPASNKVNFFFNYPEGADDVSILIYNIVGKLMKSIDYSQLRGRMKYQWEPLEDKRGHRLANGLYIYLITTENRRSGLHRLVIRR